MMTDPLYVQDSYQREAPGVVTAITDDGAILLDQPLFYPTGGGQPGDAGTLQWADGTLEISETIKAPNGGSALVPGAAGQMPPIGAQVRQSLDWDRRFGHMRIHSCLHLLSVVVPLPVSGGAITATKGRLDFNMPNAPDDKLTLQATLQELIDRDLQITQDWITDAELEANPGLVKTMSVMPPRGAGRVRLVRIGAGESQIDLQPCGGTHVGRTGEIGQIRIGKIEKKGRQNRRIYVHLVE